MKTARASRSCWSRRLKAAHPESGEAFGVREPCPALEGHVGRAGNERAMLSRGRKKSAAGADALQNLTELPPRTVVAVAFWVVGALSRFEG